MNNEQLLSQLLKSSNFTDIKNLLSDFEYSYIKKLIMNIALYVDSDIKVGDIEMSHIYDVNNELSQEITGVPSAYSAIDGDVKTLAAFAEQYSHLGIADFDALAKEAILDFLNLSNGLFVVMLSKLNIGEHSLSVPKQSDSIELTSPAEGNITVIPVTFSFGTVRFLLLRL